jgi:hypothetical protein
MTVGDIAKGGRFVNEHGHRYEYGGNAYSKPGHGLFHSLWPAGETRRHGEYTGYVAMFPYEHVRAHWTRASTKKEA